MNKNKNMKKRTACAVAVPLMLGLGLMLTPCCSRVDTEEGKGALSGEDTRIRFRADFGQEEAALKGTIPTTNETLDTIGVFAAYIPEGGDPDKLNLGYIMNVPYWRDATEGWFDTNPPRYWPVSGNMTFFALAPYDTHIMDNVDLQAIEQSRYPTIPWGPDADPKKQVDICVAVAKNQPRELTVPLEFHHATSQIYFAANYVELAEYQFIVIDTISFTNIIGEKEVTISAVPPYVTWQSDLGLPRTMGYTLTKADGHLKDVHLPLSTDAPRGVEISTDDGRLYLIPQEYTSTSTDVELRVVYTLYYENTDEHEPIDTINTFVMESVMPRCEWKPDMRYRYVLSINDVTQWVSPIVIEEYQDKRAVYYPMVCSFTLPSDTKTVGTEYKLSVQVGPVEVTPTNQEVDWYVNGVSIQDMYDYTTRADVVALPVTLEYRDASGNKLNPEDVKQLNTREVLVVCRKITSTPAVIKARTRWAATEDAHKAAEMELNVTGKGASLEPYPTTPYTW